MSELDRYDVEYMIRDEITALRAELRNEIAQARDEIRQTHRYLQQECDSIMRVLNSRTGHLDAAV